MDIKVNLLLFVIIITTFSMISYANIFGGCDIKTFGAEGTCDDNFSGQCQITKACTSEGNTPECDAPSCLCTTTICFSAIGNPPSVTVTCDAGEIDENTCSGGYSRKGYSYCTIESSTGTERVITNDPVGCGAGLEEIRTGLMNFYLESSDSVIFSSEDSF